MQMIAEGFRELDSILLPIGTKASDPRTLFLNATQAVFVGRYFEHDAEYYAYWGGDLIPHGSRVLFIPKDASGARWLYGNKAGKKAVDAGWFDALELLRDARTPAFPHTMHFVPRM